MRLAWLPWLLLLCVACASAKTSWTASRKAEMRAKVLNMFYHGYDNYLRHAFPHDELKPVTKTYTDSLAELGNAPRKEGAYKGVALTLIDSLSTLAVIGNATEFERAVRYIVANVSFDQDVRVNVFECNIRLLGGLLSGHLLAIDKNLRLFPGYDGNGLLDLANDLGHRLVAAFKYTGDIPYAWVNLRHGVEHGETREQCVAGVGTLLVEFGMLSYLTSNPVFFDMVDRAVTKMWEMRSSIDLLGNTFDGDTLQWRNNNAGIGAGIDSFYEYLVKAYILFGNTKYLRMFQETYAAVNKHLKAGNWYVEGSMHTGQHTHVQFNSLQAFWPGLQVLIGDVGAAISTQEAFFSIWRKYGALPERYLLPAFQLHSTEHYYPLRPEFIESAYYLHQATRNDYYLDMGAAVYNSLMEISRTSGGFAHIGNVGTRQLEDRMSSFFLAETCKYLYLLYDDKNFAHDYLFTTEGHLFPVQAAMQTEFGDRSMYGAAARRQTSARRLPRGMDAKDVTALASTVVCPIVNRSRWSRYVMDAKTEIIAPGHNTDAAVNFPSPTPAQQSSQAAASQCSVPGQQFQQGEFTINVGEGSFSIQHITGETVDIRNLGTDIVEVVNRRDLEAFELVIRPEGIRDYEILWQGEVFRAVGSFFGPLEADPREDIQYAGSIVSITGAGCSKVAADSLKGKIVLIDRGECTFVDKVLNMQHAGARAVIVANVLDPNNVFMMGGDGSGRTVLTPAVMVSRSTAQRLRSWANAKTNARTDGGGATPTASSGGNDPTHVVIHVRTVPAPLTANIADLTRGMGQNEPTVQGSVTEFVLTTMGGWKVHVEEKNKSFMLRLF